MTFFIIVVALFIVFALIGFHNAEKEKQKEAERQAKLEKQRKEVEENRRLIEEELDSTWERDVHNAEQYENSTLGQYTFRIKGLTYRSENDQAGARMLRLYCPLRVEHDEENEYDSYAMRVYSETGNFFLGYVEKEMSMAVYAVKDNIKACMITYYSYAALAPYISGTVYFQKVKDGVPQPYTLGTKKMDMPEEIFTDTTIQTFRSYISKALKKEDWSDRTFNEVQARTDYLLSNGVVMTEKIKEELRARGIKIPYSEN